MKLAFVADPLDSFKIYKDTTFAIMREAAARGHALYALEQEDLALRGGAVEGRAQRLHLTGEKPRWYRTEEAATASLASFDAVLMRKDPPFDMEYVYSTYLLELAEAQGARVFNRPRAIRDWNEKMGAMRFPQFAPPTVVTRRESVVREFLAEQHDVILKPLDGMGGTSVFRVREEDPNLSVIIETLTDHVGRTVMAQRFVPEIRDGDKRVLLLGGEILGWLRRVPAAGDFRSNVNAGGRCLPCDLNEAEHAMLGMSSTEWSRYMHDVIGLAEAPDEINDEVVRRMEARYAEHLPLIEGAAEAVQRLAERFRLGLASSSNRPLIETVLRATDLASVFEATVSSAGIYQGGVPATHHGVDAMADRGLDLSAHQSRQMDADMLHRADLVIAMGARLDGITTREFGLIRPDQRLIHVFPDRDVLARWRSEVAIAAARTRWLRFQPRAGTWSLRTAVTGFRWMSPT